MGCALMQTQSLADVDQAQLRTLQVEAEEHIDGLLDRRGPRRRPEWSTVVVSHIEILSHNVEQIYIWRKSAVKRFAMEGESGYWPLGPEVSMGSGRLPALFREERGQNVSSPRNETYVCRASAARSR